MDILARVLNFSLMIAMPGGLAVFLARAVKAEWRLFGVGVVTFVVSQVFHIPFNIWVLNRVLDRLGLSLDQQGFQLVLVGLFYGLSAGIFEETMRYFGYRWWIKDERDWGSALMYGTGHAGIESILLGSLVLLAFVQAISLRGTDLSIVVVADQVELTRAQIEAYWATPWHLAILGAVERMATIPFHLSATLFVLQSFRRNNISWLVLAIGWHTFVDMVAVYASRTWNPYITEGCLMAVGVVSLSIVFSLKGQALSPDAGNVQEALMPEIQPVEPSKENLDESRYV